MTLRKYLSYFCCLLLLSLWACSSIKFGKTKNKAENTTEMAKEKALTAVDSISIDTIAAVDTVIIPKEPLEYLSIDEMSMIDEINLMRGDPNAYINHIDAYLQDFINDPAWDNATKKAEMAAGNELIAELRNMEPRSGLQPHEGLYLVAQKHGEELKQRDEVSHIGSDGTHPYQRIQNNTELDGSENLVGGGMSVRESVIMLLVDAGVSNRGHRRNLLDPRWTRVACYRIGTVTEVNDTWVQLFAFEDPNDQSSEPEPEPELIKPIREMSPTTDNTEEEASETAVPSAPGDYSFMKKLEKDMIDEINLMRGNPTKYIPYIDEYVTYRKSVSIGEDPDFVAAAEELKGQLRAIEKLSILQPHEPLYKVAKAHGEDNRSHNQIEHKGSDGSDPFDRVKRSGLKNHVDSRGYFSPNENLVGGESTVRSSVIILLIDAGISSRGHRKALIDPNWTHVACYHIGLIENLPELQGSSNDDMDNCWVQLFGKQ